MSTSQLSHMVVPFSTKGVGSRGEFEGHGSVFGNLDYDGDVVVKGAFAATLQEWAAKGQLPLMPWYHDLSNPVGEYLTMKEDEIGLFVKGLLWVGGNALDRDPIEQSKQVRNLLVSNGPKGMSIGYMARKYSFGDLEGKRVRFLEDVELLELSILPFGANPKASVMSAKGLHGAPSIRETEEILRDAGYSRKQAKALLAQGFKAVEPEEERDAPEKELVDFEFLSMLAKLNHSL